MSIGPSSIRIMTVDDHPLLREGIATLIRTQPDMELIALLAMRPSYPHQRKPRLKS